MDNDCLNILNKIFGVLCVIVVLLTMLLIVSFVNTNNIKKLNGEPSISQNGDDEELGDYDVSSFEELTVTDLLNKVNEGGMQVVYFGRSSCGFCTKFLPVLKEAQSDYNYKTIYIDVTKTTSGELTKLKEINEFFEDFGRTPMIAVFKDGKYVGGTIGYTDYATFEAFLNENGVTK